MEAIQRLKELLKWSDRLGSDETQEIKEVINLLENKKVVKKENLKEPSCLLSPTQTYTTPLTAAIINGNYEI